MLYHCEAANNVKSAAAAGFFEIIDITLDKLYARVLVIHEVYPEKFYASISLCYIFEKVSFSAAYIEKPNRFFI